MNKQGQPYEDEELAQLTRKELEDTILESEVWCDKCVRGGFKTITKIKRKNRFNLIPKIWELTQLRYAARTQTSDTLETIATAHEHVITSKAQLYSLLLNQSECAICGEFRHGLNHFYTIGDNPKRADLRKLISQGIPIDEFIFEVEKCTFLCSRCADAVDIGLESVENLLPLRISIDN